MREIHLDTPFGRLAALRFGHGGTPVIALHGWLDNAASFLPLSAHLDGLDLVALDLPGHGASAHLPASAEYTLVNAARAVLSAADALGWTRFSLLGHSMGGATATLVAAGAPQRVARLALIEALGGLTEAEDRTAQRLREAFAAQAEPAGARRRVFPDVALAVRARLQAGGLGEPAARLIVERGLAPAGDGGYAWRSDARLTRPTAVRMSEAQMRDVIAAIECPVRLVHAVPAFRFFPADVRDARAACLRDAEVVGLDGGHHLHMEIPAQVAAVIGGFLRGERAAS
ncbi:alpha/beta hydrolase [Lysobacter xinjiangensis]|uniref:Alpha/beta hydrolase n=1 Tax=Cognatilysobacter xinjiangensis TaxID=546892 RepID=A0ABQ3C4U4_9GAMM|nr:alpha/beta fold hydrolase [Lysobacter xinjiangensis]GGZ68084.1 alpha/beta hydrolase [Lysobacter xinjiangensis]